MDLTPRRVVGALMFGALYLFVATIAGGSGVDGWRLVLSLALGVFLGYFAWPRVEITMRDGPV